MAKTKTTITPHPLQRKPSVPVLIKTSTTQIPIVIASCLSLTIIFILAINDVYTPNWVASILILPIVLLPFTGLIRRFVWRFLPIFIFLAFWPLGILYVIQKLLNPKTDIRNLLPYWVVGFAAAFLIEWFIAVFGTLTVILSLIVR